MPSGKKTSYSNEFKFKVALDAIRSDKTLAELVAEYNVASSLISKWRKQLLECGSNAFAATYSQQSNDKEKNLYEQLGRQAMEINYLKKFVERYQ
jgi:transposase